MASKRQQLRRSMCLGKKTFRCESDAHAEIERYEKERISLGGLGIYECKFGAHLHIGHSSEKPTLWMMWESIPIRVQEA